MHAKIIRLVLTGAEIRIKLLLRLQDFAKMCDTACVTIQTRFVNTTVLASHGRLRVQVGMFLYDHACTYIMQGLV